MVALYAINTSIGFHKRMEYDMYMCDVIMCSDDGGGGSSGHVACFVVVCCGGFPCARKS